jgi:cation transport ATPase
VIAAEAASLDVALLTGESRPQPVVVGMTVHAGSLVAGGSLQMRIEASGSDTRIGRLIATAEAEAAVRASGGSESAWERWYGPVLLILAVAVLPWGVGRSVAVIMAACPCAIGLALPLARAHVLVAARRQGLIVRSADTLVRLRRITRVVTDKTGTLTTGSPLVTAWTWEIPAVAQAWHAGAIAAAEREARHPLALAIVRHLGAVPAMHAQEVVEVPGRGLRAVVDGRSLTLGPAPAGGHQATCDGIVVARFQVTDGIRPDAPGLVAACQQRHFLLAIASGDAPAAVTAAASDLGISEHHAGQTPEEKAALVDERTLMIGDGGNDSLALARAGVGIAVRGGLAAGLGCAAVVVTDDARPLARVGDLLVAGQRLVARERLLLVGTTGYNLVAIGCALAGLWGPLICAIGMPLSSLAAIAVATAWRPFADQKANQPAP